MDRWGRLRLLYVEQPGRSQGVQQPTTLCSPSFTCLGSRGRAEGVAGDPGVHTLLGHKHMCI